MDKKSEEYLRQYIKLTALMHLPKVRKKRTWKNCDRKWMRNKEKI